jgi:hypothetical protein
MARPDGTSPVEVLKNVDQVVSRRISGDAAHFIYQSGLEIKETKISLASFTSQSHGVVARMDMVRR